MLITEASSALAKLDAAALEELGRRAELLASLNLGTVRFSGQVPMPLLKARFHGFAAIVRATGDNLATLRRVEDQRRARSCAAGVSNDACYEGPGRGLFVTSGLQDNDWHQAKGSGDRA